MKQTKQVNTNASSRKLVGTQKSVLIPHLQTSPAWQVIVLVFLGCIFMAAVDHLVTTYVMKSILKIILFLGIPALFFAIRKQPLPSFFIRPNKKQVVLSLGMGVLVFLIVILAYVLFGHLFDFSLVVGALESNVGVTKSNFVVVSIYISLMNSLLEESFFRGFAYMTLKQYTSDVVASLFSAITFALYHVAIMTGWFSPPLFLLLIASLVVAGLLFNYLVQKANTIVSSWFVHMFANFAINIIGFILFGMIQF